MAPTIRFEADTSFAQPTGSRNCCSDPRVARDLERRSGAEAGPTARGPGRWRVSARAIPSDGWLVLDKPVGHDLDPGGRHGAAHVQRRQGRPWRHARSPGHRRPADRARRGDQDRALHHGRPEDATALPLRWGEARATDDAEGEVTATSDRRPTASRDPGRRCPASPARSSRCRRPSRPSMSTASGPMTWRGPARRWSCRRGGSPSTRFELVDRPDADHAGLRSLFRQGRLYPRARPRPGAGLGTRRPYVGAAALAVGPFDEAQAISLESLAALGHSPAAFGHLSRSRPRWTTSRRWP